MLIDSFDQISSMPCVIAVTNGAINDIHVIFQKSGAGRDRTDDLLTASQALSQLSYGPFVVNKRNKVNHTTIFVGSIYVAPEAIK